MQTDNKLKMTKKGHSSSIFDVWGFLNFMLNIFDPFKIIRSYMLRPALKVFLYYYEMYKIKTQAGIINTQNIFLKLFSILLCLFLIVCAAVSFYALFYFTYMPAITHVRPVHMQYKKICDDKFSQTKCNQNTDESGASSYHSFPTAHVQLDKKQLLMVGQPYKLIVHIELPETPRNHESGMFMVCLELKDQLGKLSDHACRSAMLHYHSPLLQKIKTWVFMPLFIIGMQEQKQTLGIEMFSNFIEDSNSPVTDVYVEVQSKLVEFYSVTLHITAHFTGLRYIMFNYPVLSATIGVGTNLMLILLICLLIWYHWNDSETTNEARREMEKIDERTRPKDSCIYDDDDDDNIKTLGYDLETFLGVKDSESNTAIRKRQLKNSVEE